MRKTIYLFLLLSVVNLAKAQYFEAGFTAGASTYIGDLQPNKFATESYGLTYGGLLRYHFRPTLSFRGTALKGSFYGSDAYARNNRRFRNLESRTEFYEGSLVVEYNIGRYDIIDKKNFAPFIFVGGAGMYFNPKGRYQGAWINLAPLKTEGVKYAQIIPAGIGGAGFKVYVNSRINLNIEGGLRYTMSDYLDDVSGNYPDLEALAAENPTAAAMSFRTPELMSSAVELPSGQRRGDSYKNDMYLYFGASLTVNLANAKKMEFNPRYKYFWAPGAPKIVESENKTKQTDKNEESESKPQKAKKSGLMNKVFKSKKSKQPQSVSQDENSTSEVKEDDNTEAQEPKEAKKSKKSGLMGKVFKSKKSKDKNKKKSNDDEEENEETKE
jgi:hypothetical protein